MVKILLVQGANMNHLGQREPEHYGTTSAAELDALLHADAQAHGDRLEICYSNIEGEAMNRIYAAAAAGVQGLVMNPAGFSYAGYALRDCLKAVALPYIEVHMTNVERRGIHSVTAEVANGVITGLGVQSYVLALAGMRHLLATRRN